MIRSATVRDIDAVLELWRAAGTPPGVTNTRASLAGLLASDRDALLIALTLTAPVGSLIAVWDGWRGNLYRLAVHPARRREGIATALLREAERRLRSKGAIRLSAIVADEDQTAIEFWRASGYAQQPATARFVRHLHPGRVPRAGG
jgi:ribosomal protein S18 acetylase RimI-like enzyme